MGCWITWNRRRCDFHSCFNHPRSSSPCRNCNRSLHGYFLDNSLVFNLLLEWPTNFQFCNLDLFLGNHWHYYWSSYLQPLSRKVRQAEPYRMGAIWHVYCLCHRSATLWRSWLKEIVRCWNELVGIQVSLRYSFAAKLKMTTN